MGEKRKINIIIGVGSLVIILALLGWFLTVIFEGEKPQISVTPRPEFFAKSETFMIRASDLKRGLKILTVELNQEGRKIKVFEKKFPFKGLFNRDGVAEFSKEFSLDPVNLNLAQGRVDLEVSVRDYSRRGGGDGNLSMVQHKMLVDTIPPAIRAISRLNYINMGGTGLVVYQASSDSVKSGIYVNEKYFPGFPAEEESTVEGLHVCYFAIPHNIKTRANVYLWAEDRAGNISNANFNFHVRRKRFRRDRINITDRFLSRILPYFSSLSFEPDDTDIEKFLKINRELRKENAEALYTMITESDKRQLWSGKWIRLKNAANMAGFGDRRLYYYKGEKIDEQIHLGVDLASLANSEVQAANSGRVIFADNLGIYGKTIVLDHGQGLASLYGHLSNINVKVGDWVDRGDAIGVTGHTGLAGGDHLHFGVLVSGVPVNPIEWWDSHWIQDNVTRKLELLTK